eukprot:TRINITY_DN5738_c3_g2_i1.p1 TRINITY_DN5738_c3_g2~~TRINITY_DN5738_c3_g2_i1.p1  ORF type:complete len:471 (+),score=72.76 TRINITY_DN5738_c3_g2_i1:33-1445(+)
MKPSLTLLGAMLVGSTAKVLKPEKPLQGWNQFDFGNGTNTYGMPEFAALLAQADGVKKNLLPYGYNYMCVDGGWYSNGSFSDMDSWGRPIPEESMYPELQGSWKTIGDEFHNRGLKFGLWMTLGIPTTAYVKNTPVFASSYHAKDIVLTDGGGHPILACDWNPTVYRINTSHPGGQAYYKSMVILFEEWGLDYITLDCVFGANYQPDDIALYSKVLNESSREFVLSLSPGQANSEELATVKPLATTARINVDFYANWHEAKRHWDIAALYSNYSGDGFFMNLDKLPFGKMRGQNEVEKRWPFWPPIQKAIMVFWAFVQSPLMFGGDARLPEDCPPNDPFPCGIDDYTVELLTHQGVIDMHQDIKNPMQWYRDNATSVWVGESSGRHPTKSRYVSVYNQLCGVPPMNDPPCLNTTLFSEIRFATIGLKAGTPYHIYDLYNNTNFLMTATDTFTVTVAPMSAEVVLVTTEKL